MSKALSVPAKRAARAMTDASLVGAGIIATVGAVVAFVAPGAQGLSAALGAALGLGVIAVGFWTARAQLRSETPVLWIVLDYVLKSGLAGAAYAASRFAGGLSLRTVAIILAVSIVISAGAQIYAASSSTSTKSPKEK